MSIPEISPVVPPSSDGFTTVQSSNKKKKGRKAVVRDHVDSQVPDSPETFAQRKRGAHEENSNGDNTSIEKNDWAFMSMEPATCTDSSSPESKKAKVILHGNTPTGDRGGYYANLKLPVECEGAMEDSSDDESGEGVEGGGTGWAQPSHFSSSA
jgi:hypothetical protein